jgi:myosin heavy subunit
MHQLAFYGQRIVQMFKVNKHITVTFTTIQGGDRLTMPPHIYASAQRTYRNMQTTGRSQAIMLMGRTCSGKTTQMRHAVEYWTRVAGANNAVLTGTIH